MGSQQEHGHYIGSAAEPKLQRKRCARCGRDLPFRDEEITTARNRANPDNCDWCGRPWDDCARCGDARAECGCGEYLALNAMPAR